MESENFKEELRSKLEEIDDLVKTMPYKGDSSNESQKVCLMIAINTLDATISGIEDSDLEE
jgi:hypothetical protein